MGGACGPRHLDRGDLGAVGRQLRQTISPGTARALLAFRVGGLSSASPCCCRAASSAPSHCGTSAASRKHRSHSQPVGERCPRSSVMETTTSALLYLNGVTVCSTASRAEHPSFAVSPGDAGRSSAPTAHGKDDDVGRRHRHDAAAGGDGIFRRRTSTSRGSTRKQRSTSRHRPPVTEATFSEPQRSREPIWPRTSRSRCPRHRLGAAAPKRTASINGILATVAYALRERLAGSLSHGQKTVARDRHAAGEGAKLMSARAGRRQDRRRDAADRGAPSRRSTAPHGDRGRARHDVVRDLGVQGDGACKRHGARGGEHRQVSEKGG